ncbi:uncharacterized protein LOC129600988 [Paramacrobiotus metropolitanus]|uniref:uncharacterized protein LOC129600988 n=1 Tax=Paramacrobiotus metropolitanus TaxID=2943436 RepID=UPI00244564D1|nr:uncharacterized protein LOC129600988 [Paramacrobiotus metropolitanus]
MSRFSVALLLLSLAILIDQNAGKMELIDDMTLDCKPPAKFAGNDDQAKCFGRCKERDCLAAIYNYAGPPNRPTCAIIPKGANCLPGANGPYKLQLNVPDRDYSYRTSHSLVTTKEKKLYSAPSIPGGCSTFCSVVKGCNAVRSSPMTCQLLQLTGKQTAMRSGTGKGPLCHNNEWVYYVDKSLAPTEKGCEIKTN